MDSNQETKTACFIITYKRPDALLDSLKKIITQSYGPDYILIIDNSPADENEIKIQAFLNKNVVYWRMSSNIGPAGAAREGLRKLANMGFDYLFWADDNNPPRSSTFFRELLQGVNKLELEGMRWGIIGGKGGRLNPKTGRISSLTNRELKEGAYVEVDSIPGGHGMVINAEVVKAGILPDERLFFGFEEFDFCLKVKKAGFKNYVITEPWLEIRKEKNETADDFRWKSNSFGKKQYLRREYYSTRNLLMIFYRNGFYQAFFTLLIKSIVKMPLAFRFGLSYGLNMSRIQFKAILAFIQGKFGQDEELY
ncbi:MAG: glycosyltransferase [Bacteroidota bacterium]